MGILSSLVSSGSKVDLLDIHLMNAEAGALFFNKDKDRVGLLKEEKFSCFLKWEGPEALPYS